jgi:competence ComEA-like helix-hairpin-helix protein
MSQRLTCDRSRKEEIFSMLFRSKWHVFIMAAIVQWMPCSIAEVHAQAAVAQPVPSAPSAPSVHGVVNINSASAEQLELLPGIGPARARAILALRTRITRFARVEDLLRVKGIGRAIFRKLRPLVVLEGQSTLATNASSITRAATTPS